MGGEARERPSGSAAFSFPDDISETWRQGCQERAQILDQISLCEQPEWILRRIYSTRNLWRRIQVGGSDRGVSGEPKQRNAELYLEKKKIHSTLSKRENS